MLIYLIKFTLLLGTFSVIYALFLSNKNTFVFNRWYLLLGIIFSILIPLMSFDNLLNDLPLLKDVSIIKPIELNELIIDLKTTNESKSINWYLLFQITYFIGFSIFLLRFFFELYKLRKQYIKSKKNVYQNVKICLINQDDQIYTFGNIVFIDKNIFKNIELYQSIWRHEKTHVEQFHTIDVVLLEIIKLFFWFHPLVYLFEKNIKINHEYLADNSVLNQMNDVKKYQNELLNYLDNTNSVFVSPLNFKLTKKRFIMMNVKTKKQTNILAKITVVLAMMFTISLVACMDEHNEEKSGEVPYGEIFVEESQSKERPLNFVENKAMPKEGMQKFYSDFIRKFNLPKIESNVDEINVRLKFVIEKDGSITNIEVAKYSDEFAIQEAINVLKSMPKWNPAIHEGKIVRSTFTLPIKIRVNN